MTDSILAVNNQSNQLATGQSIELVDALRAYTDNARLIDDNANRHHVSRLSLYVDWLDTTGNHWTNPNLVDYAAYLQSDYRYSTKHNARDAKQSTLSATSINAHLSTIRSRYREIIRNPSFKDQMKATVKAMYPDASQSDQRAHRLDMLEAIQDALNPELVKVATVKKQDVIDSEHTRLTAKQAERLIDSPGIDTLMGLRDTAMISLMLSTGLREAELCALDVLDLRQTVNGELGLYVREGKGAKSRFIPYGEMTECLSFVDAWLAQANITKGAVFRGFTDRHVGKYVPGSKSPSEVYSRLTERLTVRSVNSILKRYPINIDGMLNTINPHDTRRTYAKLLWSHGMDLLAIRDNLGHADSKTTQGYIGDVDIDKRRAPDMLKSSHDAKKLQELIEIPKLDFE